MRAICFDMDGVLVNSEDFWVEREREHVLPNVVDDESVAVSEITGMNYRDMYEYLDEHYEVVMSFEAYLDLMEETAREIYTEHVSLLPGVEAFLDEARDAGVQVAIVSSSPHDWIDLVLDRFDLHEAFDAVVSAEEVERGKPAPDVYEHAAEVLGVAPGECVAVEDSEHGVAAATAAGMDCVGYFSGADESVTLDDATTVVDSPDALFETLRAYS